MGISLSLPSFRIRRLAIRENDLTPAGAGRFSRNGRWVASPKVALTVFWSAWHRVDADPPLAAHPTCYHLLGIQEALKVWSQTLAWIAERGGLSVVRVLLCRDWGSDCSDGRTSGKWCFRRGGPVGSKSCSVTSYWCRALFVGLEPQSQRLLFFLRGALQRAFG